jgi:importin subunit alpha-2
MFIVYSINEFIFLGLDKIEFLQNHENQDIYQKAFAVIERYFGSEEEDASLAPVVDAEAQQYQFNVSSQQQNDAAFEF